MRFASDSMAAGAWTALQEISQHPQHVYWDTSLNYLKVPHRHLQDPRQVTDAWLAELARIKNGKLATLEESLAPFHETCSSDFLCIDKSAPFNHR